MMISKDQLRKIIRESLISEQVMWHSTAPENVEGILSQGLLVGRESAQTMGGEWADEFYGTRPIYLSAQKGKYEGQPLAVNTSGLSLVADLPTLVDTGAYQEEEGMYWDEGAEPAQMIDIVDEDGMVYFDELLSPGSAAAQAAIDLTGTAAVVQDIPSKSISTEEGSLKSDEPSAVESEWASKSQAEKDDHVKNAVWETMAWKRYRKHAQEEGIPFDPDNEDDMKVARAWWKKQPESRQFEGKMRITRGQIRKIIRETLIRESNWNQSLGGPGLSDLPWASADGSFDANISAAMAVAAENGFNASQFLNEDSDFDMSGVDGYDALRALEDGFVEQEQIPYETADESGVIRIGTVKEYGITENIGVIDVMGYQTWIR